MPSSAANATYVNTGAGCSRRGFVVFAKCVSGFAAVSRGIALDVFNAIAKLVRRVATRLLRLDEGMRNWKELSPPNEDRITADSPRETTA
jgi:hypothetical protein